MKGREKRNTLKQIALLKSEFKNNVDHNENYDDLIFNYFLSFNDEKNKFLSFLLSLLIHSGFIIEINVVLIFNLFFFLIFFFFFF
jgi:hypothetical protein